MINGKKIGLGCVTFKREAYFRTVISTVLEAPIDYLCVVNAGSIPYKDSVYPKHAEVILCKEDTYVAKSKNILLRKMIENNCDYMFVWEDDIIIKNPIVFEKYIQLSNLSGIQTLNFGFHGPANMLNGKPNPRYVLDGYGDVKLALNHHCVGAFQFFTKECIEKVGLMDEKFVNAFEHVEHTYQIIKAGMHPHFWYFADLANSYEYLDEIKGSIDNSSIRQNAKWNENIVNGRNCFLQKHGIDVLSLPNVNVIETVKFLKDIKSK